MRPIAMLIMMMLASMPLFAQRVNGIVFDRSTSQPIALATVKSGYNVIATDMAGKFSFNLRSVNDTALVTNMGYKPYHVVFKASADTIKIYLQQVSILLKDVKVASRRDFKKDSVRNRRMFSSVYNYKAPGIKDALTQKAILAYIPSNQINVQNSTTSLMGVNVLSLIGLLNKNKNSINKLQKVMLKDEESSYIERVFSKQKVENVTMLKGDSLQNFIIKYRPSVTEAKNMTEYELVMYIKKSYAEFIK
ncbi:hypothetical protein ACFQ3S_00960 [Mucilaginibacter terrae]|uniref:hypothetical protein n=1 Tax=Mucilaginibacter terrae TaxID=1955052 RepID=UPI00363BBAEB